ncbi:MAG: alpha/beta hydrolase [Microcella sp.]|uniref:esterase/lipase family protein n=1 Tax=Microcella sp. TaxID=1913979 RepID=UPI002725C2AF|nr:alpha/beta fold hydrolase [Microcella sp.]MDO8336850.1 alpha/beta hydrolase [Microcella sp.]
MLERTGGVIRDYGFVARSRWRSIRIGSTPPDPGTGRAAPVLLIPGVFETWHYLEAIGDRLTAEGHPVHFLERLGLNRHPIEETAALVREHLEELDLRDVVIVGHSKGGLIGKQLMTVEDRDERISRLIAINTPFPGAPLARYTVSAWREFAPDRPVIRSLAQATEVNGRIVSIFSAFDQYIPGSSRLDGATNVKLPLVGHFRVLEDPLVLDEVARWAAEPRH